MPWDRKIAICNFLCCLSQEVNREADRENHVIGLNILPIRKHSLNPFALGLYQLLTHSPILAVPHSHPCTMSPIYTTPCTSSLIHATLLIQYIPSNPFAPSSTHDASFMPPCVLGAFFLICATTFVSWCTIAYLTCVYLLCTLTHRPASCLSHSSLYFHVLSLILPCTLRNPFVVNWQDVALPNSCDIWLTITTGIAVPKWCCHTLQPHYLVMEILVLIAIICQGITVSKNRLLFSWHISFVYSSGNIPNCILRVQNYEP